MSRINRLVVLPALLSAIALPACGSSSNDDKIASAKASEHTEVDVRATLEEKLDFYRGDDFYDDDDFQVAGGNCTIILVLVGSDMVDLYQGDSVLKAPDGNTGVKVGTYQGTPLSTCLTAVKDAMSW